MRERAFLCLKDLRSHLLALIRTHSLPNSSSMEYHILSIGSYRLYHAIIVVVVSIVARFLFKLYKVRRTMIRLKNQGLVSTAVPR